MRLLTIAGGTVLHKAAVLLLILATLATGCGGPEGAGMVHSCNRWLLDDSGEVDYHESTALKWEENVYQVSLVSAAGRELGECRVDVTQDTYVVSNWSYERLDN